MNKQLEKMIKERVLSIIDSNLRIKKIKNCKQSK